MEPGDLEEGDLVLFNDRKTPLEVVETGDEITVKGPQGALYTIYEENNSLLVCSKDQKRYSSYCEELRKVGEWIETDNGWRHSKSDAEILIERKDNGFWTVKTVGIDEEIDVPLYGFTDKEFAREEAEKFLDKNPEG